MLQINPQQMEHENQNYCYSNLYKTASAEAIEKGKSAWNNYKGNRINNINVKFHIWNNCLGKSKASGIENGTIGMQGNKMNNTNVKFHIWNNWNIALENKKQVALKMEQLACKATELTTTLISSSY